MTTLRFGFSKQFDTIPNPQQVYITAEGERAFIRIRANTH